jgi:hypothetical protein
MPSEFRPVSENTIPILTIALAVSLVAVTAVGATNDIEGLRKEFRSRCAILATQSLRPGSSDALVKRIQTIARDVFAEHPDALHATNEKWFEGLPIATQQELDAFKSEWAMPTDASGKDMRAILSQVPLPKEASRYYMQGINPADVVHQILDFARSMTGVPSEVMLLQVYVPPDVKSVRTGDDSYNIMIRTFWCEVRAKLEMTQAGLFVPTAIEGRKTLRNQPPEGTR